MRVFCGTLFAVMCVAFSFFSDFLTKICCKIVALLKERNIKISSVDFVRFTWVNKRPDRVINDDKEEKEEGVGSSKWTLRFDTEGYYGDAAKTFFPEVAVTFRVESGQRYHVPLLLSPFGYTTYRGS